MDSPRYILVVDDEVMLAQTMQEILEVEGLKVRCVYNARQAMEQIHNEVPALVITDTNMPERSGLELLEDIRAISKDIPVIMMSGFLSTEKMKHALELGVVDFLEKPVDFGKLLDLIQKSISKTAGTMPSSAQNEEVSITLSRATFDELTKKADQEQISLKEYLEKLAA